MRWCASHSVGDLLEGAQAQGISRCDEKLEGATISTWTEFQREYGLMFANIMVNGQMLEALVNTKASNLFVTKGAVKKLSLKPNRKASFIKMMNSKEIPTMGSTIVNVQLGAWKGKQPIGVIPMDGYDCVIGIGFLNKINALLVPFVNCICVLGTKGQCVVPVKKRCNLNAKLLSTMQLVKGAQRIEETFVAILKLEDTLRAFVKASIEVLDEFKGVILASLPNRLPLQREIDHHIEVEPRA
ncbi:Uncharacterized protein TCM_014489 [Theobroma cacao]|uniref:Uncharacterized protein n=1 Tax=Theobroma cacao TaxID=3641 RepID=A0A061FYE9_THECC|nr:Uncharacterized protein TCM_014489 [Theobroma cacao]